MKTLWLQWSLACAVLVGCAVDPSQRGSDELDVLRCDAGYVPWTFASRDGGPETSESVAQNPGAVAVPREGLKTLSVLEARCVEGRWFTGVSPKAATAGSAAWPA